MAEYATVSEIVEALEHDETWYKPDFRKNRYIVMKKGGNRFTDIVFRSGEWKEVSEDAFNAAVKYLNDIRPVGVRSDDYHMIMPMVLAHMENFNGSGDEEKHFFFPQTKTLLRQINECMYHDAHLYVRQELVSRKYRKYATATGPRSCNYNFEWPEVDINNNPVYYAVLRYKVKRDKTYGWYICTWNKHYEETEVDIAEVFPAVFSS